MSTPWMIRAGVGEAQQVDKTEKKELHPDGLPILRTATQRVSGGSALLKTGARDDDFALWESAPHYRLTS